MNLSDATDNLRDKAKDSTMDDKAKEIAQKKIEEMRNKKSEASE
jgi:hypothetical protein